MKNRFLTFVEDNALIMHGQRVLLALSGGIDSVCLAHLLKEAHFHFAIAHCNFRLRGEESDQDAEFAAELARQLLVPFFSTSFETESFAKANKVSVQMAARELRYRWFEEIRQKEGYDSIATGHHLDDQVETFFINLLRGTGIAGLRGFPPRNGNIIRPLLSFSRKEISEYVHARNITYREDSSNLSLYYERNIIRQKLIPILEKLQSNFGNIMAGNFERLREAEEIMLSAVMKEKEKLLKQKGNAFILDIGGLKKLDPLHAYLFYFLKDFNFNPATVHDIADSLKNTETRVFYSDSYVLTRERNQIRIEKKEDLTDSEFQVFSIGLSLKKIPRHPASFQLDVPLSAMLSRETKSGETVFGNDENTALLDFDKLAEPLTIRRWKTGDQFHPLGMKGKKKLSDFFIDQKYSPREKAESWLLCSCENIVWVIGKRLDERYKIRKSTKNILRIEVL